MIEITEIEYFKKYKVSYNGYEAFANHSVYGIDSSFNLFLTGEFIKRVELENCSEQTMLEKIKLEIDYNIQKHLMNLKST